MNKRVLDLGCGNKKRAGAVGIDNNNNINTDIKHDLNSFPYPLENNYFDEIYLDNILGELDSLFKTMEEVYRVGKIGCKVVVIVPYFRSRYAYIHPNIKSFFNVDTFCYFDKDHDIYKRYKYTLSQFKTKKIVFDENISSSKLNHIIKLFANKWPRSYEKYLSHLFPLDLLTFYLEKE
tara:strand:+ start:267 stop:800 length:534 start_codon:yes stop_codon:yes gene_type:complete